MAKMRKAGMAVIPTIVGLCQRFGLSVDGVRFDDLSAKGTHIARLQQLERVTSVFVQSLRDELLLAQSDAWTGTVAAYSMLKGAARKNRDIGKELEHVHSFFTTRRGQKSVDAPVKAPPTSNATPKGSEAPAA
jgi:hypothetical protein